MDYINLLHASGIYEKQTAKIIPFRSIDIFENAVSAGTGNFLVDGPKETVRIDESILPEDTIHTDCISAVLSVNPCVIFHRSKHHLRMLCTHSDSSGDLLITGIMSIVQLPISTISVFFAIVGILSTTAA